MPSNPRPITRTALAAVAVMAFVLLGACTGQETAKSYSSDVEEEFLFGCTTGGEAQNEAGRFVRSDTTDPEEQEAIDAAKEKMKADVPNIEAICQCTYDRLKDEVPFDELKEITGDLEREPDALPADLRKISESCAEQEGSGESS